MGFGDHLLLLAAAAPFAIWAIWTDLRSMLILNVCNIGLFLAFCAVGGFVFDLPDFTLRLAQAPIVLAVGAILLMTGHFGGGDWKFLGAMAPWIAWQDAVWVAYLLAVMALVSVVLHRAVAYLPAVRARLGNWKSMQDLRRFPYGVPLALTLIAYLVRPLI